MLALFWVCAALIVIAQVMILRSTRRAFRGGRPGDSGVGAGAGDAESGVAPRSQSAMMEWLFAVGPAVAIAFLLFFTWRAASRPPVMDVRFDGSVVSAEVPK